MDQESNNRKKIAENTSFAPAISDTLQSLSDNKGFDVNVQNPGITYSKDFLGGTIEAGISGMGTDEPKAGLFYNKVI